MIVQSKLYGPTTQWPPELAETAEFVSKTAIGSLGATVLTGIPSSDSSLGRFQGLLDTIANGLGVEAGNTLRWTEPVTRQVNLHSAGARDSNVNGKLAAVDDVEGLDIVVFDDVWTTGATVREAGRALRAAGAASVSVATLAKTAYTEPTTPGHWVITSDVDSANITFSVSFHHDSANYHCYRGHIDFRAVILYLSKHRHKTPDHLALSINASDTGTWEMTKVQPTTYKYDRGRSNETGRPDFILLPDVVIEEWNTPQHLEVHFQP